MGPAEFILDSALLDVKELLPDHECHLPCLQVLVDVNGIILPFVFYIFDRPYNHSRPSSETLKELPSINFINDLLDCDDSFLKDKFRMMVK